MSEKPQVSFIGLGAMGFGMATHLVSEGYDVVGFDVWAPTLERFAAAGGKTATTPAAAAAGRPVCVVMVATSAQAQAVLIDGPDAAVPALPPHAAIVLCSTVAAGYVQSLQKQLVDPAGPVKRPDLQLIDAPVSGGAMRAADGTLAIMVGAAETATAVGTAARTVLDVMADPKQLYLVSSAMGAGSNTKMVHQVLATIQMLGASEAVGLAFLLGLERSQSTLDKLQAAPGRSWMVGHRGPRMLTDFQPLASALHIATKDMGIITREARDNGFVPLLTSVTENVALDGLSRGWAFDDDSCLLRLYTTGRDKIGAPSPAAVLETLSATNPAVAADPIRLVVAVQKAIHLGAAAECLAFAHRVGLDLDLVLGLCISAAGGTAMLETHGPSIVSALRNGTAATGWSAEAGSDTLESIFQDLLEAINVFQQLKASVHLGAQALNIFSLTRQLLGGDASKLAPGSIVKLWL